ncbi:methyltransferase [Desulfovibrio sp. JC010]|uniref:methyltransferase n=1 Tax=Desulfovibrio sp. JC010 TaxID=2593641 RepID=UPI0013D6AA00|nr:methyltransferase [Desulfovibrio sp. JC010]NDV27500.1 methyltransferase [Desulfovibrio sp. JC010]
MTANSVPALILPSRQEILRLQEHENAWYLSGAFDLVVRKHGLLGVDPFYGDLRGAAYGFLGRNTVWRSEWENSPLVIEAPLDASVCAALDVKCIETSAADIFLEELNIGCGYSSCKVRKIPAKGKDYSDPFSFSPQDSRWCRGEFSVKFFQPDERWKPLLHGVTPDGKKGIVAVTDGVRLVLGFPFFDISVYQHSLPPLGDTGYYSMEVNRPTWKLEGWLMDQAERLFSEAGCPVLRAHDWPEGYTAAFSVRHDMDRPVGADDLASILQTYDELKLRASFFFLTRTAKAGLISLLRERGHEIALHTEASSAVGLGEEKQRLENIMGEPVSGFTTHGGRGGVGYLGATHYAWGEENGFGYGELLGKDNKLPHCGFNLGSGVPRASGIMVPGVHSSLDTGMKPEAHNLELLLRYLPTRLREGAHCVVMNHPDIHLPQLAELLGELDFGSVWKAPLGTVCQWNATLKASSRVSHDGDRIVLEFERPLSHAAAIRFSDRVGSKNFSIPEGAVRFEVDRKTGKGQVMHEEDRLQRFFPTIERLIVQDFEAQGMTREQAAGTLRVNTEMLTGRTRMLVGGLRLSSGHHVAELGCGFGFCALGLHRVSGARVTGFDINPRFLKLGDALLETHPELNRFLSFRQLDYVEDAPGEREYDAVILNNTFCYIVGRERQRAAIENIRKSLVPGGAVCFYQFNPWFFREPFTKLPFVHWLPRTAGDMVARKLGRRQLSDLDYVSPVRLRTMLQKAGFGNVRFLPGGSPFSWRRPKRSFFPYYAMTARLC